VKGRIDPDRPTLVRMHTMNMFADTLGEIGERSDLLHDAMRMIGESGAGVVVVINRRTQKWLSTIMNARAGGKPGGDDEMNELRDYGIGAQILAELGIHDMVLLTNSHHTLVALAGYGLNIVGERPIVAGVH
jgi:3,4-dihydroxy 2-butanone 4-phosphate synthase/GTP cyclohydrolase II